MQLQLARTQTLSAIPDGIGGIKVTLARMTDLVREYKSDPVIRRLANILTQHLNQKDFRGEVEALFHFVQNDIRYLQDIADIETLQTPVVTLEERAGDCDDKSTLLAALLESINHKTRFKAIGCGGEPISHVYIETRIGRDWVALDATEPYAMGWEPPCISSCRLSHN